MKRLSSKYLIIFLSIVFLILSITKENIVFLSLKKYLFMCVSKHYLFGLVTILKFLWTDSTRIEWRNLVL